MRTDLNSEDFWNHKWKTDMKMDGNINSFQNSASKILLFNYLCNKIGKLNLKMDAIINSFDLFIFCHFCYFSIKSNFKMCWTSIKNNNVCFNKIILHKK